jgi:FkbM family methyltransferase
VKEVIRALLPRRARPHRILRGPLRGRIIVTSWHDYPGAILGRTELGLVNWFQRNVEAGETWLDVGAHYGYTAIALAERVGPTGRVFAFEPVLETAGCLSLTRSINRLDWLAVIPFGLGSSKGVQLIRVPMVRGMAEYRDSREVSNQVCLTSFDEIWTSLSNGVPVIHGIKIDVQGAEHEVVMGMRRYLAEYLPKLVIELHAGVDRPLLMQRLQSLGYSRTGLPVEDREPPPPYIDNHSYVFSTR